MNKGIPMLKTIITGKDRENAKKCKECPICNKARQKQKGIIYLFVKIIENKLGCPYCKAYEKVYGKKAYER